MVQGRLRKKEKKVSERVAARPFFSSSFFEEPKFFIDEGKGNTLYSRTQLSQPNNSKAVCFEEETTTSCVLRGKKPAGRKREKERREKGEMKKWEEH